MIDKKELKEIISKKYFIKINKIEKNEDSTDGNVYMINAFGNRYVAKIYNNFEHVQSMIKLHTELYSEGFYVPKIILNDENNDYMKLTDEEYIVIYSFLQGKEIGKKFEKIPESVIKDIAKQLRKIHDITKENRFGLKMLPFNDYNIKRCSTLHFDLTKNNIFYKDGKIGFIDFDDARFGPSVCDVAIAICLLFFSKTKGINEDGLKMFIESYYGENIILKKEEVPLIKNFAINWIDYIMQEHEFTTSTKESFIIKRKLIKEFKEII